jgi:hypothetical protein
VKAAGIAMQGNKVVPAWVVDRIANLHFQRFLASLLFNKAIFARERPAVHGLRLS